VNGDLAKTEKKETVGLLQVLISLELGPVQHVLDDRGYLHCYNGMTGLFIDIFVAENISVPAHPLVLTGKHLSEHELHIYFAYPFMVQDQQLTNKESQKYLYQAR